MDRAARICEVFLVVEPVKSEAFTLVDFEESSACQRNTVPARTRWRFRVNNEFNVQKLGSTSMQLSYFSVTLSPLVDSIDPNLVV